MNETLDAYQTYAAEYAQYYRDVNAARVQDIENAFKFVGRQHPSVVEIGCADGRDAAEILNRTPNYLGFDITPAFIDMAKKNVPSATFEVGDARTFDYPENTDIVFAFASLIHLNKEDLEHTLSAVHKSLSENGILYISMKAGQTYTSQLKKDKYSTRQFYLYNPDLISEITDAMFNVVFTYTGFKTSVDTEWFEMAMRKR